MTRTVGVRSLKLCALRLCQSFGCNSLVRGMLEALVKFVELTQPSVDQQNFTKIKKEALRGLSKVQSSWSAALERSLSAAFFALRVRLGPPLIVIVNCILYFLRCGFRGFHACARQPPCPRDCCQQQWPRHRRGLAVSQPWNSLIISSY